MVIESRSIAISSPARRPPAGSRPIAAAADSHIAAVDQLLLLLAAAVAVRSSSCEPLDLSIERRYGPVRTSCMPSRDAASQQRSEHTAGCMVLPSTAAAWNRPSISDCPCQTSASALSGSLVIFSQRRTATTQRAAEPLVPGRNLRAPQLPRGLPLYGAGVGPAAPRDRRSRRTGAAADLRRRRNLCHLGLAAQEGRGREGSSVVG